MEKAGEKSSSLRNLLGFYPSYAPDDPSMNVSVHSSSSAASRLSPFLNVDPYVNAEPEFILPEGANRTRGRFEFAFGTIGSGVMMGGAFGGVNGLVSGCRATQVMTGKVRRTQMINYVSKTGSSSANALGVMAVMYSGFGCFLSWYRDTDDDANTMASATLTGLLYKSTAGLRRCAIGGGVGFALAAAYCLWRGGEKDRSIVNYVGSKYSSSASKY